MMPLQHHLQVYKGADLQQLSWGEIMCRHGALSLAPGLSLARGFSHDSPSLYLNEEHLQNA